MAFRSPRFPKSRYPGQRVTLPPKPAFKPFKAKAKIGAPKVLGGNLPPAPQNPADIGAQAIAGYQASLAPVAPVTPTAPPVTTANDSVYQQQIDALNTRLANENLGYQGQETGLQSEFGFDPQYAQNPYTRASILNTRANQRFEGTTNSMAGAGQLYSGAVNNARAADAMTSGGELNDARHELSDKMAAIQQQRLASQSQFGIDRASAFQALQERLQAAEPDASQFSTGDSGGSNEGDGSDNAKGGSKKKSSKKAPPKKAPPKKQQWHATAVVGQKKRK